MKSKLLLTTSIFTLSMLTGCLDEVTEASALDASELTCKTEPLDDNSGLKIICGGDSVGVVQNGKDGKDGENGKDGKNGADGKDGSSCYVTENAEINGYDVFCDNKKVGELRNGKDGQDGKNGTDGKDGTSCSVVKNEKVNGYEVYCGTEFIGYLTNGTDGKNGIDGKDGNDGSSCTVEVNDDINGFDVVCAGKKVGELRNGKDGQDGADGKDGSSCYVTENAEINGYDVFCGDEKIGSIVNGKDGEKGADGKDGDKGADGKDGKDGSSCTIAENAEIDGYDVICDNKKVGELRNGKDAVLPSSSSIASSSSTTSSSCSDVSSSSEVESSSSEISSSSETPSSSSVEQLSEKCKTLRATTDVFNSLYDVLGCTRSDEKVVIILRHAQRDIHKYGDDDGLIEVGRQQAKQVGEKLKELNLDDFYYMYTNVKRTAETAQIIAISKGENVSTDINDWHKHNIANLTEINQNLKESWYVKPNQNASNCKGGASWGWSSYSKIAYQEYDDDNNRQNCENAFYPIDTRIEAFIENYFTYEQMHKYTLAISHDQYLVPFVITISNKKIHDDIVNSKYDLRFHLHDRDINWNPDFNYWINYLAGVVLIVDADNNVIKLPVKALDDGFLRKYENP
ncbi:MAG: histidine phosphatase family protein [Fibrobacter sp.]|nr:histidine phosphatase family protein [Fibrobacter sp.]